MGVKVGIDSRLQSTFECWGWAGWLGSEGLSVSCITEREWGEGTFGVLSLLLSRLSLSLFFGVRHFDEVACVCSCLVVYGGMVGRKVGLGLIMHLVSSIR